MKKICYIFSSKENAQNAPLLKQILKNIFHCVLFVCSTTYIVGCSVVKTYHRYIKNGSSFTAGYQVI